MRAPEIVSSAMAAVEPGTCFLVCDTLPAVSPARTAARIAQRPRVVLLLWIRVVLRANVNVAQPATHRR